jgi:hypothetical protein
MKFPILAMLATSPAHGYELKRELEQHFGAALPPLNTGDGQKALDEWVAQPTPGTRLRDEFFMKLVLAGRAGIADPRALIERQRGEYLQALRDLDRLQAATNGDAAQSLLIEGAALHLEADLKWLALCEDRLNSEVTPWSTS